MNICRENAFGLSLGDPEIRELTVVSLSKQQEQYTAKGHQ